MTILYSNCHNVRVCYGDASTITLTKPYHLLSTVNNLNSDS